MKFTEDDLRFAAISLDNKCYYGKCKKCYFNEKGMKQFCPVTINVGKFYHEYEIEATIDELTKNKHDKKKNKK